MQNSEITFNVREFDATGDGRTLDTRAIQAAIDACAEQGGGTVVVPPGRYLSGTLHLCDDLDLVIQKGATVVASKDESQFDPPEEVKYPDAQGDECAIFHYGLLTAEEVGNLRIRGGGNLDDERHHRHGPKPVALKHCYNVTLRDLTLHHSGSYAVSLGNCEIVRVDNVRVLYSNADGIVLDSCRNVRVSHCHVESRDDAIVLKGSLAYGEPTPSANVVVTGCDLATSCVGIKVGTESNGDFTNLLFANCVIHPLGVARPPLAGIALESVDGARLQGVTISNVNMSGLKSAFFVRLGRRLRGGWPDVPGTISDVLVTNLSARNVHFPVVVAGLPEAPVERLTLGNVHLEFDYSRGGTFAPGETYRDNKKRPPGVTDYTRIPENPERYPDIRMFGDPLPAWAVFARHVTDLYFNNVHCYLATPDPRPADLFVDARRVHHAGLHFHVRGPGSQEGATSGTGE